LRRRRIIGLELLADGTAARQADDASHRWMVWPHRRSTARLLTTNCYKLLPLTIQKHRAIDLILAGYRDQEVANEIGAHGITVNQWRLHRTTLCSLRPSISGVDC
jgi:hypothetical protein